MIVLMLFAFGLGGVSTWLAVRGLGKELRLRRIGIRARAVFVGEEKRPSSNVPGVYTTRPVVEFQVASGQHFQAMPPIRSSMKALAEGSAVTVFYNPDDPNEAVVAGYIAGITVFLVVGVALIGFAVALPFIAASSAVG